MRWWPNSLGLKLNLALMIFFLVLGVATAAFVFAGFNRTRDNASARSEEALEDLGADVVQYIAYTQADYGASSMEWASELGHRASRYLEDFKASGATAPYDVSRLVQRADDVWYDPDPSRISDLVVPNHVSKLEGGVIDDIAYSAPLDAIFQALIEGFPGESSGDAYHPIGIIFVGLNGVGRYYPPIGIQETIAAEVDLSSFPSRFGPEGNPERLTNWTTPYEDKLGQGLVITAQTPIYEGDTFRGIFEVDLSISKLVDVIDEIKPTDSGFAFYVDKEGNILPTDSYHLLAAELDNGNEVLAGVIERMTRGEPGTDRVVLGGREYYLASAPMTGVGGGFAVVAPISELTAKASAITAGIDKQADRTMLLVLGSMTVLFAVGLVGATYLNRRVLLRPIEALAAGTRAVAQGDLETRIEVAGNDELALLAGSFNQMTAEIVAARDDLERQVEERTRELSALLEVSRNVASTLELQPLLNLIIEQVEGVAEYSRCSLYLLEGDALRLLASRVHGSVAPPPGSHQFRVQEMGSFWQRLSEGQSVVIADLHVEDDALVTDIRRALGPQLERAIGGIHALMAVPLSLNDRVFGMLTLNHDQRGFYGEQHAQLVSAIAAQAAVAIENARLYEQAQQLAAVEERQRLARELHDSVSQALYGIALGARTARTLLDQDAARAVEPVDYVLQLAEAGLAEMRALIFELRPESLETEGLVAALEKQTAATRARYGLDVEVQLGEEPPLSMHEKEVFYRIGQEALHNVVKHARASRVEVSLTTDGAVSLEVRDNGVGFDTGQGFPGHMGLVSMRERAASIGAEVAIESAPGAGTTVRLYRRLTS